MYHVTIYDRFNADIIKNIDLDSFILAEHMFWHWLKHDACFGERITLFHGEKSIKSIVVRKPI